MPFSSIDTISVEDIRKHPVWRFASNRQSGETALVPIRKLPCKNLNGKVVGVQVEVADGTRVWGIVGNFDPGNPRMNQHFVTISIESNGRWFHLARYHDYDFKERGPAALAAFLERDVDSVFPLTFDLSGAVQGDHESLRGMIHKEPKERLTRSEIIAIAVP